MRIGPTWLLWLGATIGCACAPARPADEAARVQAPSGHADFLEVCRCADEAGAHHLAAALGAIHGGATAEAQPAGDFARCASAINGIPSAAAYAASDDAPVWSRLPHGALGMSDDGTLTVAGVLGGVLVGEHGRLRSIAVAFRENALACQACQAMAIAVATHVSSRGEPSAGDRALVDEAAKRARAAASRAGVALGLSAALDATLRKKLPAAELVRLAARLDADPDGTLDDATSRVWSIAAALRSDALSRWIRQERAASEARGRRPLQLGATPPLRRLALARAPVPEAARGMLAGLWARDVGAMMRGAASLHGRHDPARVVLAATRRALRDDFAGALRIARDVVPIYSHAAEPLERLDARLGRAR